MSVPTLRTPKPRRHLGAAIAGVTLLAAVLATGCGVTHVNAPVLTVVTSLYPLAEAAEEVGAAQVRVVDLATPNVNPRTMALSAAQVAEVHRASLVIDIGGGFQPSVEAAAQGSKRVLALLPALGGTNPDVWLDPKLMERASTLIQEALTSAEPSAKAVFADGQEDLFAELSSLDIDFESSLSVCPDSTLVTSDDAFARMAGRYGIADRTIGTNQSPDRAQVRAAATAITNSHSITAFSEPYVDNTFLAVAAQSAGVKVATLNTLETPPVSGSRVVVSYSNLMETDLRAITGALQCPSTDQD